MPMQAGKREETLAIGREVAEQASHAPGFVGWIAVWTDKEEAAALSLWDSMDTIRLQASSERARDVMADSRRRMQPLAANRLRGGEFEVAYCKLPSGIAAQSSRLRT